MSGERRRSMMGGKKVEVDYSTRYFTLKALQSGTFKHTEFAVQYSINGGTTWYTLSSGSSTPTITAGTKVLFKGTLTPGAFKGIGTFTGTGNFEAEGNVMSLLYGDNFEGQVDLTGKNYAFYGLFRSANKLVKAKNLSLPATTLINYCYNAMFYGCTSLTTPPALPATTLADNCYSAMFYGCTSLTTAPTLTATTLTRYCYAQMFYNCVSLTTAPELPATTLALQCYNQMFFGTNIIPDYSNIDFTSQSVVASGGLAGFFSGTNVTDEILNGILPKDSNNRYYLPVTTLGDYSYYNMFYGCTLLTTPPALPATTLTYYCYAGMFQYCTSLTTAPELPATTLAEYCYNAMFYGCTSLTTAPELPATTLAGRCYLSMFMECSSLTTAPELLATTLVDNCYAYIFKGCSSLNYIKAMFTTTPSRQLTYQWVDGVASTGTFVKNSAATWNETGVTGVPSGWTVQTAAT